MLQGLKIDPDPFFLCLITEVYAEDCLGHGGRVRLLSALQQSRGLGQQIQPPLQAGGVADRQQKIIILV